MVCVQTSVLFLCVLGAVVVLVVVALISSC